MKIAAVTVTWKRPIQLGRMIGCFLAQDYPDRELVILDDAGQYENQEGDRWRLTSTSRRFPTLGAKRNAALTLVSPDVDAVAVWDDDDCYLPWALSASVAALQHACWSRPGIVLHPAPGGKLTQHQTWSIKTPRRKLYHATWAFRRETLQGMGGYSAVMNNGEDQQLMQRLMHATTTEADPCELGFRPFGVCSWQPGPWSLPDESPKLSWLGFHGYRDMDTTPAGKATITPMLPTFFDYHNPDIVPGIQARKF